MTSPVNYLHFNFSPKLIKVQFSPVFLRNEKGGKKLYLEVATISQDSTLRFLPPFYHYGGYNYSFKVEESNKTLHWKPKITKVTEKFQEEIQRSLKCSKELFRQVSLKLPFHPEGIQDDSLSEIRKCLPIFQAHLGLLYTNQQYLYWHLGTVAASFTVVSAVSSSWQWM